MHAYEIDNSLTLYYIICMNFISVRLPFLVNFNWPLHEMDIFNLFLYINLKEKMFMELSLGHVGGDRYYVAYKLNHASMYLIYTIEMKFIHYYYYVIFVMKYMNI